LNALLLLFLKRTEKQQDLLHHYFLLRDFTDVGCLLFENEHFSLV